MEWMILPLKRYAQFSGRSRRKEFWMWVLFTILASLVLSFLDGVLGLGGRNTAGPPGVPGVTGYGGSVRGGLLANIFALATLVPNITVAVRRLHDTDRSGWWVVMPVVPLFVGIFGLVGGFVTGIGGSLMIVGGIALLVAFITGILLLVWYCTDGTRGANRFGADPKADIPADLQRTFE